MYLEERVAKIEARNKKVEADKAWETSWTRKGLIAVFTYIVISGYMIFILHINPWINAIVPTVGFLLSTFTVSWLKKLWIKYLYKR